MASAGELAARPPRAHVLGIGVERLESRTLLAAGDEPGLEAWFRADAISLPSGAAIASWPDSSGSNLPATQSVAARRPTFLAQGLNGRPSVRFDAADATQLSFSRPVSGDFTIVAVFGSTQGVGDGTAWYGGAGLVDGEVAGVTNDFGVSLNANGQVLAGTGNPDRFVASGMGFDDGRAHVAVFTRSAATGAISLHVDGLLFETTTAGRQALTSPFRLTIGSLQTNTNYFTGDVGEVRVYSTALEDAQRSTVEGEIVTAYNVAPAPAGWFDNPVIGRDFPDPGVVYANGTYYAFATNSGGRNVQAARSTDLVHWTALPDALPTLPSWARAGRTWAPDVAAMASGTYNLYYTAWSRTNDRQVIGVATSSSPAGPFTPAGTAPLITQTSLGGAIDASVFTDANGVRYLLWKNDGNAVGVDTHIHLQQLSSDGLSLVGASTRLIHQDRPWEGNLVEGPVLWTHEGKYYLFYSANSYANGAYATGYAVADSLRGPYTKPDVALMRTEGEVVGPGGPEIVTGPDGNTWILYHSWENNFSYRGMSIDRLEWVDAAPSDIPAVRGPSRALQPVPVRPRVTARYVFYNNSVLDGADPAPTRGDDDAIAPDKRALLPGQSPTFINLTSYTRGINGVIIDVTALPVETSTLPPSGFTVRVGSGGDPATWAAGPSPSAVTIRRGEGVNGSDRITLIWPDGAIRNRWLQVTVPSPSTGLAAPDRFSFGNLVGETDDQPHTGRHAVTALDIVRTRRALFSDADITSPYDFNRDGRVSVLDFAIARSAQGGVLQTITPPPTPLPVTSPLQDEERVSLLA
jgi:GH43 family beta-xylosidase